MENVDLRLSVKKTQNRATIIGIQGNCQMENRNVKSMKYWNIGVMGEWGGEGAFAGHGMLIILLSPVIARSVSDEATCSDSI